MFWAVARPLLSPATSKESATPGVSHSAPFWMFILCAKRSPSKLSETTNPHSPFQERHEPVSVMPMQWSYLLVVWTGRACATAVAGTPSILPVKGSACTNAICGAMIAAGAAPMKLTCAACVRPRWSVARWNCTGRPTELGPGISPTKASLCTKRSPSKRSGATMKPQASFHDRSMPVRTSPLSRICDGTLGPAQPPATPMVEFGMSMGVAPPMMTVMGSSGNTFAAWDLPLASTMTSKLTVRFTSACAISRALLGFTSRCTCSWWQKRSPSK
mmetsp:Transcript_48411/g.144585  ORF Transcript_48411/g.144585 Transcript_48411/m.144585 type:complete len:273 (+) Transcript_48411:362-1180(+)